MIENRDDLLIGSRDTDSQDMPIHIFDQHLAHLPRLSLGGSVIFTVSLFDGTNKLQSTFYADDLSSVCHSIDRGKNDTHGEENTI